MVSTSRKKSPNKRMLFQVDRTLVSTRMENVFKNTFLTKKLLWQEYVKNQRKSLPIAMIRDLNRLLYNLNNGFH